MGKPESLEQRGIIRVRGDGMTKKEYIYLQKFSHLENYYISRNKKGNLRLHTEKPEQSETEWFFTCKTFGDTWYGIILNDRALQFITWESGKAWSKSELMELEVGE